MLVKKRLGMSNWVRVWVEQEQPSGGTIRWLDADISNTLTDGWLNAIRDNMSSTSQTDLQVTYLAWGNSTAAESSTFTTLGSELGRKQVTSYSPGSTGVLTITTFLSQSDANVQIEELGWFAGDASAVADSGTLVGRTKWNRNKTSLESVQVDRVDSLLETTT